MRYKTKEERYVNAKARSLKISYEELKRQFGESLMILIHELAGISGEDSQVIHSIMRQNSGGAILQSTSISFEEIDDFFEQKMKDAQNGVAIPSLIGDLVNAVADEIENQSMYDKLKEIASHHTEEAMAAYGKAKCISVPMVKRMLKDSHCAAFLEDVIYHFMNSMAEIARMRSPYPWTRSKYNIITAETVLIICLDAIETGINRKANDVFKALTGYYPEESA